MRKHFKMVNVVNHSISIERPRLSQLHECGIPNCRESEFISHTQPVTVRFSWNSPRLNMSGSVLEAWEGGTSKQFAWVSSKRRNWVVPFYLNWIAGMWGGGGGMATLRAKAPPMHFLLSPNIHYRLLFIYFL